MRFAFLALLPLFQACSEDGSVEEIVQAVEKERGIAFHYNPLFKSVAEQWDGDADQNGLVDTLFFERVDMLDSSGEKTGPGSAHDTLFSLDRLVIAYSFGEGRTIVVRTNVHSLLKFNSGIPERSQNIRVIGGTEQATLSIVDSLGIRRYLCSKDILLPLEPAEQSAPSEVEGIGFKSR